LWRRPEIWLLERTAASWKYLEDSPLPPRCDLALRVYPELDNGRPSDGRRTIYSAVYFDRKMIFPAVGSRTEQTHEFSTHWVTSRGPVRLVQVAEAAPKGKVSIIGSPTTGRGLDMARLQKGN
jgi:hypothetical protein